jgi:ribose 5-phosphate isomerase B
MGGSSGCKGAGDAGARVGLRRQVALGAGLLSPLRRKERRGSRREEKNAAMSAGPTFDRGPGLEGVERYDGRLLAVPLRRRIVIYFSLAVNRSRRHETMAIVDERGKKVITELEVRALSSGDRIRISQSAIITPLAADMMRDLGVGVERSDKRSPWKKYRIALGADHGGYEAKEALKATLAELGHDFRDFGTTSTDPVDYPDFAHVVALAVSRGQYDLGIIVDGAGIGSCMVANKVPGIRAALCYDQSSARNSREHNGANILTLGGKMLPIEKLREIVTAWLATELTEERHKRRVAKITAIEREYRQS